jgi:hypothetical protein
MVFSRFLNELLCFEGLSSRVLFDFFLTFCESNCVPRAAEFFIKTVLASDVITPAMAEDARLRPILKDFLAAVFRTRLLPPSHYLLAVLGQRREREQRVNQPLVRLFWKIADDHSSAFCVDAILNDKVVKKFSDSPLFEELLGCLRKFPPPVISDDLRKQISATGSQGTSLGAAYFSLLPDELRSDDFTTVFQYFIQKVDRSTSTFWTLWLRDKVFYRAGFPVTIVTKPQTGEHMEQLCHEFTSLLFNCESPITERTSIYLNCWVLLCQNNQLANLVVQKLIEDLRRDRENLIRPILIDYLHPVLVQISEDQFNHLCDGFLAFKFQPNELDAFVHVAFSVFVVYVSRMSSIAAQMLPLARHILKLLPVLFERSSPVTVFGIDTFNYLISQVAHVQTAFYPGNALYRAFKEEIQEDLRAIPAELAGFLLRIEPPADDREVKKPLFRDFRLKTREKSPEDVLDQAPSTRSTCLICGLVDR